MARRSFFVCQIEPAQAAPDRDAVDLDPKPLPQFDHQFIKGQVALFLDPARDPAHHTRQLAVPTAVALGLGLKQTRRALQKHHIVHKLDRNAELSRRSPVRVTIFDKINDPTTKLHRKWLAHQ